jgi:MFS family permease
LTASEEAGLNSVVFAGMCVGAPVWGMVSDSYGRKTSFFLATLISAVFGFATAAAPNFHVSGFRQVEAGCLRCS